MADKPAPQLILRKSPRQLILEKKTGPTPSLKGTLPSAKSLPPILQLAPLKPSTPTVPYDDAYRTA